MRPIRPEDEELYPPFLSRVSQEDLQLRFFAPVKQFDHVFIARFTSWTTPVRWRLSPSTNHPAK